jgi:essential nuclear protein 1
MKILKNKETIINPKELKILQRTGLMLRIYRSGKLPKVLKIIPVLENFEEFLWFTRPDRWSSQALLVVSRFFISKLNHQKLKRYFSCVIAPRIQEEIFKKQKICRNVFKLIKLSSINEKMFFTSIIIPLSCSKNCTNKETAFLASIISTQSFSRSHIYSLLVFLTKDKIINESKIRVLRAIISKKYNLPNRIKEYIIDFFLKNRAIVSKAILKNCVLIFLKNYLLFLTPEEKKKFIEIL